MELIENQQAYAFKRRVVLQAAGQDALCDHFDAGVGANIAVETNPIADGLTDLFTQFTGQTLSRRTGGQTSRFEHDDALAGKPRLVQQGQRHAGGFTRTGRRFEHRFVTFTQGLAQRGQHFINRQRNHGGSKTVRRV